MAYLLLVLEDRGYRASCSVEEAQNLHDRLLAFGLGLTARGQLIACELLAADDDAVRVSAAADKPPRREGPFAENAEMLGAFFLINVASREEAIAVAKRCPAIEWATVEVRDCAPLYID